ncbi:protein POF1B isoform X1 [Melanotaenia boesemani]|uniref:protein POF1B isoform X1 n=2 Tax=Melanotaenia boesemani TaxID=1250792 RepID=UPI001C0551EA|nr:protein POF1B isoform X1 [Melanotaenia boesemani]
MSVQTSQKTTTRTYRTVNLASSEPVTTAVSSVSPVTQVSSVPYTVNGSYDTVRYLVPVQQAVQQQQSFVLMQQPMMSQPMMSQPMMSQPLMQQVMSPVYLQTLPRLSVSSQDSDVVFQQQSALESISGKSSSVFSQSSSPVKSPALSVEEEEEEVVEEEEEEEEGGMVEVEEVEIVNVIQQKSPPVTERLSRTELRAELREVPEPTKLDTRYFGELLADVYRKNCDIHSCISDHVTRIRGQKHQLDLSNDFKVEKDEVEALIPKGATELTKQQMRYLLQTRLTADKSMRMLLSTFSSLREELLQMSEDLRRLESEKESLERDLTFKADQARQYDSLLEAVRDNNRQLQLSLKEASATQRSMESQLMRSRSTDSSREFKIKELEGRMRALEKENEMLRQKLAGQASSSTLHIKTEELSRQYNEQLNVMKQEKDQEIQRLRSQITKIQTEVSSTQSSSDQSLQLRISELLSMLEQRQTTITRQEEEIRKLMQERSDSSKNVTKTIITKRYRNQYPILGLLSDDYQVTSPVKEAKTIVIERTGEMIKQEIITTP